MIVFIGLLLIFNALSGMLFDHTIKAFDSPFPKGGAFPSRWRCASRSASWWAFRRCGWRGTIPGAFFGAIFIQFVPNIADEISKSAPAAIYGLMLIGFMFLLPTGVMGGVKKLWARLIR